MIFGASAGGSHGGRGGTDSAANVYGDSQAPLLPGSGGGGGKGVGGNGGGAILISTKHLILDGEFSVDGGDCNDSSTRSWSGGGSGGSIFIRCQTLSGAGRVHANGGFGSLYAGGGGGGRIAVVYDPSAQHLMAGPSEVEFSARGGGNGLGGWGSQAPENFGEPGTLYFTGEAASGHIVPLSGQVVGANPPVPNPRLQTVAYWMPWVTNPPIATVRKGIHLIHPRPRAAALCSIQYVGPDLELMRIQSVEVRDDVHGEIQQSFSSDNGRTWSVPRPQPANDVLFGKIEGWEGLGAMEYDSAAGVLVQTWLRQFHVGGLYHHTTYYALSRDFGKTWSALKPLRYEDGDDFDVSDPLKAGYLSRNQGYPGSNILIHSNGTLITVLAHANAPGDAANETRPFRMGSLCFVGRWNRQAQDYDWKPGNRVETTPDVSVRGLMEPEVAELKGGRVLVVWRGATAPGPEGGKLRAKVPGRKWYSVSDDGGLTLSPVREWKYDDGTSFYSPSSIHRMIRHSKTGKLYWIGNISPVPPSGNEPRYPLVIAEVDESIPALKRATVTLIDDRDPKTQGPMLQLSNFALIENRESHDLNLWLTTYGQETGQAEWATADCYQYTVTLK